MRYRIGITSIDLFYKKILHNFRRDRVIAFILSMLKVHVKGIVIAKEKLLPLCKVNKTY